MDERNIDVSVVMLGVRAEARERVQEAMRAIAEKGDTRGPAGLVRMLREAIDVLREASSEWTHAGVESHVPMPAREAEARFVAAAQRARARFEHELIRNFDGTMSTAPTPEIDADPDAEGVVVVTLVVASRCELADVADVHDRAELVRALDALSAIEPADFVAMEVVWSPADVRERVSARQIEARHPELARLAHG